MTQVFHEGELEIVVGADTLCRKFDGTEHGLTCMKAVDFIIELEDRILFLEIKDPDCTAGIVHTNRQRFLEDFRAGRLDVELVGKFRDSFLYEWAAARSGENEKKPIYFCVLLAAASLDRALLQRRTDRLKAALPLDGPASGVWQRKLAHGCAVLNLESWESSYPAIRITRVVP